MHFSLIFAENALILVDSESHRLHDQTGIKKFLIVLEQQFNYVEFKYSNHPIHPTNLLVFTGFFPNFIC